LKKISIVTASYCSEATIVDTIRSVNRQTYRNIEHIIVDGASKDKTIELVRAEGQRIACVVSESDKGIYDAYNKGLSLITGDVVGFLNSDDFYCSDSVIEKVMTVFEDESVEACYADLVYVDRDDTAKIIRHWKSKPYKTGLFGKAFVPAHPTLFLRRSVYDKVGRFDLSYRLAADYEFMLRIFHRFDVKSVYIPEIFVKMRAGGATGGSLTSIRKQNEEIVSALHQHGVAYSKIIFFLYKFFDRFAQKVRARFISPNKPLGPI